MMGKTHYAAGALFAAAGLPALNAAAGTGFTPVEMTVGVGIGMIAGVLPDIDHPDSLVTKGLLPGRKLFGRVGKILGWWLSIPPRVVGVGARSVGNHRGPTHTLGFMLAWTLLATPIYALQIVAGALIGSVFLNAISGILIEPLTPWAIQVDPAGVMPWMVENAPSVMPLVMASVFLGYLAHLATDSMTKVPIPFFWPLLSLSRRFFFPLLPKPLRVTTDSPRENLLIRPVIILMTVLIYVGLIGLPLVRDSGSVGASVADKVENAAKTQVDKQREKRKTPRAPIVPLDQQP